MLTVDDQGTVVLSGANSYSGGTAVSDGTLVLTNASAIASGTSLTIGTDATSLFGPAQTASIVTAPTSSAIVFAAATTSVVSVGVGSRVDSAVALSVKPAAMSPVAIDAVLTSHRSVLGPAIAPPHLVPASGAWMWLVTGSFANTSDISQTADSNVEALDTVLARFGL
jgi:autotransporter-associated beta strand protein